MKMRKVHPNATTTTTSLVDSSSSTMLTVWKKSLLFNCDGFTVFDGKGNLIFRVDNYISGSKGEIILMDASGNSLYTIRRKRLSLADHWVVFQGDETINPLFSVTKPMMMMNLLNSDKSLAQVMDIKRKEVMYEIEGCYRKRCCGVYDEKRRLVAEIKRKEAMGGKVALGLDVFNLVVHMDCSATAMALVILLDHMFQPCTRNRRFT